MFYLLYKIFSKNLSDQSIILASFGISGLLFSLNYVLPLIFFGHIGMCLYYFDRDEEGVAEDEEEEDFDDYVVTERRLKSQATSFS